MSTVVIKPDFSSDLYAVYSEHTDGILMTGSRAAVRRYLVADADRPTDAAPAVVEGRLRRADEFGSSSMIPLGDGSGGCLYGWRDTELRIGAGPGAPGVMHRNDLLGYCRELAADREKAASSRVVPDED